MSSLFNVRGLSFDWPDGNSVFMDLHFSLSSRCTALVGANGSGKSVIARLLAKELPPTAGQIQRTTTWSFFSQREKPPAQSLAEYLSGISYWDFPGSELLHDLDLSASCSSLSGGQWARVRLTRALRECFLILDEPTNDLDRDGRDIFRRFLRQHAQGALLISHDREALELCDEVMELTAKGLQIFGGPWSKFEIARHQERERLLENLGRAKQARAQAQQDRQLQKQRQEKRRHRGAQNAARGGLPKILLGGRKRQAQSTSGRIESETLDRAEKKVQAAHEAFMNLKTDPVMFADLQSAPLPAQKLIAEARDFNIRYGDWLYPKNLNFIWRGNIRLAIKGANGSGKSSLLKALTAKVPIQKGELRIGDLDILFIDQSCSVLDDSMSVLENTSRRASGDEAELRAGLAKFLFTGEKAFQQASSLSGGERLRAALACGFLAVKRPQLVILDEPTNNLDLPNIEFLENLLRSYNGALILVSHDENFVQNCNMGEEFYLGR